MSVNFLFFTDGRNAQVCVHGVVLQNTNTCDDGDDDDVTAIGKLLYNNFIRHKW